jgi:hypothetical protein
MAMWFARIAVGAVFAVNVWCALVFIFQPDVYASGFELEGVAGKVMVQGMGILFLMWNATYPPVIWNPQKFRVLFIVLLIQQLIGVVGETWLWLNLPQGHANLSASGLRFIVFDAAGLVVMSTAYALFFWKQNVNK